MPTIGDWMNAITKPSWLPEYDLAAFFRKVEREYPYGAEQGMSGYGNARLLQELHAAIGICQAFEMMSSPRAYDLASLVREEEIAAALSANAGSGEATYTGLLNLLVEAGILLRCKDG